MSKGFTELPEDFWKGVGTAFMWLAIGGICLNQPENTEHLVGSACLATVLIWLFG